MTKVVILGAGISGLSAAYKLSKKNFDVTILEKENFFGGLASGFEVEWDGRKYSLTKTYHHILQKDGSTKNLIEELGMCNKFHVKRVKQGFVFKNKVVGFSTPFEILNFPISFRDKVRLAKFVLKKKKYDGRMSAEEYLIRDVGKNNFNVFFDQLIKNKFKTSAENISAAWLATRFEKEPLSFLRGFGRIEGGFSSFVDRLVEKLVEKNVKIVTGVEIKKIVDSGGIKEVFFEKGGVGEKERADFIVNTIPPKSFLRVYNRLSQGLRMKLEKIEYLSCVSACIGFDFNLTEKYWINILDKGFPFDILFNHTSLYKDLAPAGKSVVYLVSYLKLPSDFWHKSEAEIFEIYIEALERIFPGCGKNVDWYSVFKLPDADVIYSMGFENPPISENGIYFAGIYRMYPKIRNVASAIESGFEVAEKIIGDSHS